MRPASLSVFFLIYAATCSGQSAAVVQAAVAPHYPPIAVAARVTGTVSVRLQIDSKGAVLHAEATEGPRLLKDASEVTAKLWKFEPASDSQREATLRFVYVLLPETADAQYDVEFRPPYEVVVEKHPAKQSMSDGSATVTSPHGGLSHEPGHSQGTSAP